MNEHSVYRDLAERVRRREFNTAFRIGFMCGVGAGLLLATVLYLWLG